MRYHTKHVHCTDATKKNVLKFPKKNYVININKPFFLRFININLLNFTSQWFVPNALPSLCRLKVKKPNMLLMNISIRIHILDKKNGSQYPDPLKKIK